ncbi:MAG: two-component system sensor histidine kinase NtrB [Candidatus Anammoxibacter sp.]
MKILVLDYNDKYQNDLIDFLINNGCDVLISLTLENIIEIFKKELPDFIILNREHPEVQTYRFYRTIEPVIQKDYNPLLILADENVIKQCAKDSRLDQVYWLSKAKSHLEILDWLKEQKRLKVKYSEVVRSKKCMQETCHITTAILNAVPSALVVVDEQMVVTNFNHGFNKLFDIGPSPISGMHICDLIHKEDKINAIEVHANNCRFIKAIESSSVLDKSLFGEEVKLIGKNGESQYYTIITSRLPSINFRILIDIRDITERKKHDADIALRDRLASLGGLSIGVAHEINNPNGAIRLGAKNINTILEMLTPVMMNVKKENPDLRFGSLTIDKVIERLPQLCDGILSATERVAAVVDNLKNFGRKDIGGSKKPININNAIKNAVQLTKHVLNETGELDLQMDEDIPAVKGHETEIEQVIINLISNACDSIKERKTRAENGYSGKITIKSFCRNGVVIEVTDNGTGIKDESKGKIFDPYYTSKPFGAGTGLGLSISQNIIKKHEGELTFKSKPGYGTTFQIELLPTNSEK